MSRQVASVDITSNFTIEHMLSQLPKLSDASTPITIYVLEPR
jgi:hypothetical protein